MLERTDCLLEKIIGLIIQLLIKHQYLNINLVKEHINSFPKVESHYCRRDSSKLYLSSDLNKAVMYRLYTDNF